MFRGPLFLVFVVIFYDKVNADPGFCVMEGPCTEGPYGEELNCVNKRPAAPLPPDEKDQYQTLKDLCPHLVPDGEPPVCCSAKQIATLSSNLELSSALLGRCPSCVENFKTLFCDLTCSPDQDNFLVPTATEDMTENPDRKVLKAVTYYLNKSYAEQTFDSCKNVVGLMPGMNALELMCGLWGKDCTTERWLQFLGTDMSNGGMSPFAINFLLLTEENYKDGEKAVVPPLHTALKCSEPAGKLRERCNCVDCPASC